ncbi:hypothetical protein PG997_013477 [Apiospora hydei]|uniref:Major facilitator superfamily (MFS) profile domain-containing protein n=1 Tax=Apiospora hydei TaxID=1337664 RepID=A0ABR1V698_9PEZI
MKPYFGLRGKQLNYAIGIIAGCDFLLFGYDQGVMGGILTMRNFLDDFPDIDPDGTPDKALQATRSETQGIAVAAYNLGCFLGAVITIWIGNPLGRRRMIILGTAIMVIGAILQASATTLPHFIVGRVITGIGNGGNTSTVPTWQSGDLAIAQARQARHDRGRAHHLWYYDQLLDRSWLQFRPGQRGLAFPAGVPDRLLNLPESPRWLVLREKEDEALDVLAALADTSIDDKEVRNEFIAIKDTVLEMKKGRFSDLFTQGKDRNFHRTLLGYTNQMFRPNTDASTIEQISGINLITYYAPVIYASLGMSSFMARLLAAINGTEYFIASWPAVYLVERVGRRKLMLFGAAGQAASMAILAGANSQEDSAPLPDRRCRLPLRFQHLLRHRMARHDLAVPPPRSSLCESEPLPTPCPLQVTNWIFNFMVVMITPVAFNTIGYQTYIIFAVINAFMVPSVYFFYPETAYRSLEEMDAIFPQGGRRRGLLPGRQRRAQ